MWLDEEDKQELVRRVTQIFHTFGGGKVNLNNPISVALENDPPVFAAGVNVRSVVNLIVKSIDSFDETVYTLKDLEDMENI